MDFLKSGSFFMKKKIIISLSRARYKPFHSRVHIFLIIELRIEVILWRRWWCHHTTRIPPRILQNIGVIFKCTLYIKNSYWICFWRVTAWRGSLLPHHRARSMWHTRCTTASMRTCNCTKANIEYIMYAYIMWNVSTSSKFAGDSSRRIEWYCCQR